MMRMMVACVVMAIAFVLVGCSQRQDALVSRSTSVETTTDEDAVLDWVEALETELRQNPRPFTEEEWAKVKQLCEDTDPEHRIAGLYLLGFAYYDQQHRSEAVQIAKLLLDDPEPDVRASAILTLQDLDARDAAPDIQQLLNDPDEHVQEDARSVLQEWGYPVTQSSSETGS
jgi:cytochrome c-type biogenesis protein CcmH/NrfG